MLEDRDYMRQSEYHEPRVSFAIALLVVNAVVFIAQIIVSNSEHASRIETEYFALSLYGLKHGFVWQLLTFQFMHANWMHLLFNSLAIFFFGRPVENRIGGGKFLMLYFSSGIIGGLLQMLFAFSLPLFNGAVVGASAGAYGLVAAFALMNWYERFTLFLYFIPVTMRGRTLLWISIALAIVGLATPGNGIANAAHLGGIIGGFFIARQMFKSSWQPPGEFSPVRAVKKLWQSTPASSSDELPTEEFVSKEVDPILEKISAHGIQSLTDRERQILDKARSKMNKR
jgi:membrane associated rhomboid family serine protease